MKGLKSGIAGLLLLCITGPLLAEAVHFGKGSFIGDEIFVSDKSGSQVGLTEIFREQPAKLNVLFIFGGGDLGSGMNGHLWCQDSYEDTHILRTVAGAYKEDQVNFIAVASPPVYHSQILGKAAGVFFNAEQGSDEFKDAQQAFVDSTMEAYKDGVLPIEPYFDMRFRLMLSRDESRMPKGPAYGSVLDWHGAFRSETETQFYGVPSFWLLSDAGEVLAAPLRGNSYHPHGSEINISYTVKDLITLINAQLAE